VLEIGPGSGAIAVTLACERPDVRVDAVELSPAAAEVTRANAAKHGVSERVTVSGGNATLVVTFSEAVGSAALVRSDGGTPADYSPVPASGPAASGSSTRPSASPSPCHSWRSP
jgi:hypothetical protein